MGIKGESESATSLLMEDHVHNPRDLFISIYLASQGFPIVTYVTWGQDTVSEMPRAAPFTSHPLIHQGLGSSRGLGVHCCYTVPLLPSIPECLNPKLEALDQQTGERRAYPPSPCFRPFTSQSCAQTRPTGQHKGERRAQLQNQNFPSSLTF